MIDFTQSLSAFVIGVIVIVAFGLARVLPVILADGIGHPALGSVNWQSPVSLLIGFLPGYLPWQPFRFTRAGKYTASQAVPEAVSVETRLTLF